MSPFDEILQHSVAVHRNAGIALGCELLEFELSHDSVSTSKTSCGNCLRPRVRRAAEPRGNALDLAAPAAPATRGESLELCGEELHGWTIPWQVACASRGWPRRNPWRRRSPTRRRRCRR